MTGVPIGLVVALMDAADQASGGPGIVDRADEKLVAYLRNAPGRGSSSTFRWNPYGSKGYPSRRRGGPTRRTPTRRPDFYRAPRRRPQRKFPDSAVRKKRCPSGYYYSYKHRRCMKSKFR